MCSIIGYLGDHISLDALTKGFDRSKMRGPDMTRWYHQEEVHLGFHRLAIMDLSENGMQPFVQNTTITLCNGEIYNYRHLRSQYLSDLKWESESDCEVLGPLFERLGVSMFAKLDAEFAVIIYDQNKHQLIAARDPIGIRPLFYGYDTSNQIIFASEARCLIGLVDQIIPFPPGHYYENGQFICYRDLTQTTAYHHAEIDTICQGIHDRLIQAVEKRLMSDAPVGFLLSGGLDSSLVCAIASKLSDKPIETFAIGMDKDAIDLKYAKEVAEYIGSHHTEVIINTKDVLEALPTVISLLGTYDITTIRASIGMYLVCRYIHEHTPIKVLLTGEISDELFGYKYTDFAPDAHAFQEEAKKRIKELYMYDVLRADRCISDNAMEGRVPFGDLDFVTYVMQIDPEMKLNKYQKGKYLLRHAFEQDHILPQNILMREKAAFSDAVGHSMVDDLKAYAKRHYTTQMVEDAKRKYQINPPISEESLLYREIFESFYPHQAQMIQAFWMPNKDWEGCDVDDPSARVLKNYGDSGK